MKRKVQFALLVALAISIGWFYYFWPRQHPCYDPNFQPILPQSINLAADLDLEPITVDNAAHLIQLDIEDNTAIYDILIVLESAPWMSLLDRPQGNIPEILTDNVLIQQRATHGYPLVGDNLGRIYLSLGWNEDLTDPIFSPNRRCIIFGSSFGKFRFWDIQANDEIKSIEVAGILEEERILESIALSEDNRFLVYGTIGDNDSVGPTLIGIWDLARTKEVAILKTSSSVVSLAISPDGQFVVAAGGRHITLWDVSQESQVFDAESQEGYIAGVIFGSNGQLIALGSYDGEIRFWDATTGQQVAVLQAGELTDFAFSPDMRLLITIDTEGTISYFGVPD